MTTFIKRALSALILGPLMILLLWRGFPYAQGLLCLLLGMCFIEWWRLCFVIKKNKDEAPGLSWFAGGAFYILASFGALFMISYTSPIFLIGLFLIIWASDIGAYLVGKVVGGPKCFPTLSPNKTWSGVMGGFLAALGAGYLLIQHTGWKVFNPQGTYSLLHNLILVGAIAVLSQTGDLIESTVKRFFKVKDTGTLIPGHGGFLDRFDSPLAVGFVAFILLVINNFWAFLSVSPSQAYVMTLPPF